MKAFWTSFVLLAGVSLTPAHAQTGPSRPDLSGQWSRDPTAGSLADARWGARVSISQSGSSLTVRPSPGVPENYQLDGAETAEVISAAGCRSTTRITKASSGPGKVTITTWIVNKTACFHGEDEDDPLVPGPGPIAVNKVLGTRRLESITDVYRDADVLTVETTRSASFGSPTTTTTVYRK